MSFDLNYQDLIHLDAEDLAETGIGKAYQSLLPVLRKYIQHPATIEEAIDNDSSRYAVRCGLKEYIIYEPDLMNENGESWGGATYALFALVNDQLGNSSHRFYAINGGNDLGGMFLTQNQAVEARKALRNKTDWPYLPTLESPWFGQEH